MGRMRLLLLAALGFLLTEAVGSALKRPPTERPVADPMRDTPITAEALWPPRLSIAIKSLRRGRGEWRLAYTFEWVKGCDTEIPFTFIRPWGTLVMLGWDGEGNALGQVDLLDYLLRPDFLLTRVRRHEGSEEVVIPTGVRHIAIGFPQANILSRRWPVPR